MVERKLRWGILSTAKIGIRSVIPAIQQSNNGVVAAIASRDGQHARETAQALGIPRAFDSYDALLDSPDNDAVYIPLPNSLHKEWTLRAATRGKHILCEKPFALNASQVDEMIAAARQRRVLLMEAFMYRFHPQFARVKELIAEGAVGKVQVIRSAFGFQLDDLNNIRLSHELGGGSLMDVGCYCVNVSRLIAAAEPVEVHASMVLGEKSQVDETLSSILRFPDGVVAHFDSSFRSAYREWLEIQGADGRLELERPFRSHAIGGAGKLILHRKDDTQVFTTPAVNQYQLMVEHFADAALNGKALLYPPADGRANMRVIDGLYESARTGCAIQL